jgi:hypothetical protein
VIWVWLSRITPVRWFTENMDRPQCWRYRIAFPVFSNAWWYGDHCVGLQHFPHFTAAVDRVYAGKSIMLP